MSSLRFSQFLTDKERRKYLEAFIKKDRAEREKAYYLNRYPERQEMQEAFTTEISEYQQQINKFVELQGERWGKFKNHSQFIKKYYRNKRAN